MRNVFLYVLLFLATVQAGAQEPDKMIKKVAGVVDSYPMLSPDGKKIVFESDRTGTNQIYVMDNDGKNIRQLTFPENNYPTASAPGTITPLRYGDKHDNNCPIWSPDGKYIVFASERDNDSEIYIMNADGSEQKRLTHQKGDDSHPHFSPDGRRIIFNSARTTPDLTIDWVRQIHEIFTMNIDGSDVKQISRFGTVSTYPSISPDGKKICFRQLVNEPGFNYDMSVSKRNSEVFVMNIDGTDAVNISNNTAHDGWPVWTKNGHILFSSGRGGAARVSQLYRSDDRGKKLERISNLKHSLIQASISPDGKMVYCQYNIEEVAGFESGGIVSLVLPVLSAN
jgi:TolB protein